MFAAKTVAFNGASIAWDVLQHGLAFAKCVTKKNQSLKPETTVISLLAFTNLNSPFKNHENSSCHCSPFHAGIGLQ